MFLLGKQEYGIVNKKEGWGGGVSEVHGEVHKKMPKQWEKVALQPINKGSSS